MYSDNTYEDVGAIPGGGTGITGREYFRIQNNDCYSVSPVPARLTESNGKRKSKRFGPSSKNFILISALAVILCMLSALITTGVFFSVQVSKLKIQLSELEKCNENATSKESQGNFNE